MGPRTLESGERLAGQRDGLYMRAAELKRQRNAKPWRPSPGLDRVMRPPPCLNDGSKATLDATAPWRI